jgi:hypothetical protein
VLRDVARGHQQAFQFKAPFSSILVKHIRWYTFLLLNQSILHLINELSDESNSLKFDQELFWLNHRNRSNWLSNSIELIVDFDRINLRIWSNQSSNLIKSNVEFDLIDLRHNTGKIYQSSKSVGSITDSVARISCHIFHALSWIFM